MNDKSRPTLQNVILRLQDFWSDQGCVIWQPYHTEVGAGTMNPATFLRVLGPESWWVAYVEPSIRPADGRYGENPNRWQHYYQFQVILKPDPGDPIERYLQSLVALGIKPEEHDIRFVEDNWISPALGAWGLGWEVWLDGQEITQYTYFQQAGGQTLDPVSVEITYGLERIVLALQDVDSFVEIKWNDRVTYGELNLTSEQEHSRYNFETADVERLRMLYDEYETEAEACLAKGMVFPAHDYILKCSHTFNLLDARGAIGVTERAALFGRMRDLARQVAHDYVEQREALGFPLRDRWSFSPPQSNDSKDDRPAPDSPADFILEIGTEELPAADLDSVIDQLTTSVPQMLADHRLAHDGVVISATPRRLVTHVKTLAPSQADRVSLVKGPPAERAFDEQGKPTKVAEGFARSKNVSVEDLDVRDVDGGRYVVVEVREAGVSTDEVMTETLPAMIAVLRFEKSMRWNQSGVAFSRPIRWLLALHGDHCVPFEYAGLTSDRQTRLMRFDDPEQVSIKDVKTYFKTIDAHGIILEGEARANEILGQASRLAKEVGGELQVDEALLGEVVNLVEKPTALRGQFAKNFLELPNSVLISVMRKHQRYFPVEKNGELLPYFIAVRNGGEEHLDVVTRGNEQVIRARFADADYFFRRDLEKPLEDYLPRLSTLTFQADLGSMLAKTERIERLTEMLADKLDLSTQARKTAIRAAHLAKADLATLMVIEMTSLQGEMGGVYALRSGEPAAVAQAIREHYLPRFQGDRLPESEPGDVVGLADRLDSLMGLFAAGIQPSGASDPFAMRRTAIGLVQLLISKQIRFDLIEALQMAAGGLPLKDSKAQIPACLAFIIARLQTLLLGEGAAYDAVEAVLAVQGQDPAGAVSAIEVLKQYRQRKDWDEILQAYARCVRITRAEQTIYAVNPKKLVEPAEKALLKELEKAEKVSREAGSVDDFLETFIPIIPAITSFFDEVLVMAEDEQLRCNRLGLLQRIVALADGVIDLSKLEGF